MVTIPNNTTTMLSYDFGADRFGQTRFRTTVIDANGVRSEQYRNVRSQIVTVNEFNNHAATVLPAGRHRQAHHHRHHLS